MRIAIAQMRTVAGDFAGTASRMAAYSRRAADEGADLLVFPMAALCGAAAVAPVDREGFMLDLADCVLGLAGELACPCLLPVLTMVDGAAVPDALLVSGDDVVPVGLSARVRGMAAAGAADDDGSDSLPEFEFAGARLGVAFTYEDLDVYDDYDYNVDVVVFLSGYGLAVDDPSSALGTSLTEGRFLADARATGAWIVGVGSLGCYDRQLFCGSSFVLAPWGELAAQAPSLEEDLLVCDVDPSAEGPLEAPLTPEVYDAPLMTWGALSMGLAETCERLGVAGACCVADGSLASALVTTLATDALGPGRVRVLVAGAEGAPARAAADLVRSLRIPADHVEALDAPRADPAAPPADLLAEVRLAELARRTGLLPLGRLDKTARALEEPPALDAARLHPLGDLYRSDLVSLAHLRNTISPVMPQASLAAYDVPAVDGLEEAFPAAETRLAFVDLVLSSYLEWELPVSDIADERGHAELVEAVVGRLCARLSELGDACVPALTASSRTLEEARPPVGLAWCDRVREEGERLSGRLASLSEPDNDAGGPAGEGDADAGREREIRDLLGYLRDFSAGGGFSPIGPGPAGAEQARRHGDAPDGSAPSFWEGPFSEN